MCTDPEVAPMLLPTWCAAHLNQTSRALLDVKRQGDNTPSLISRALGFSRSGWSAVDAKASNERALSAALMYDRLRFEGARAEDAYRLVQHSIPGGRKNSARLKEIESVRRLVRRGKKMLQHVREYTDYISATREVAAIAGALTQAVEATKQRLGVRRRRP
jgi:hypothetical protein